MELVIQIFWFSVAGATGFIVDTGVLYLLKPIQGLYLARLVSFLSAALVTWLFNRNITFRQRVSGHSARKELGIYVCLMTLGGLVNYSIYAWLVFTRAWVAAHPVIGVAAGSLSGMLVNLSTSRLLLFRIKAQ